jgi:hypothetical protein
MRRLLPGRVRIAHAPSQAMPALGATDVVLLEDRSWPRDEEDALGQLRELSAAYKLALVLSRLRGEAGDAMRVPVVERPYRLEEVARAIQEALLRRRA